MTLDRSRKRDSKWCPSQKLGKYMMTNKPVYIDEDFPCVNCIAFAACKAQMGIARYEYVLRRLIPKCSLLHAYVYSVIDFIKDDIIEPQGKIEAIRSYFHHYGEENGTM